MMYGMNSIKLSDLQEMGTDFTPEVKSSDEIEPIRINEKYIIRLPETISALLIAGNIIVFIFAFCGNIAAVILCARSKFSRPTTRFFLISLAISDFIVANFSIIPALAQIMDRYHSWVLGEFMCLITDYTQTFAIMTNGCCLIAVSVDRYLVVVRGLKSPILSDKCATYCGYMFRFLVWAVPLAMCVPMIPIYYLHPLIVYISTYNETGDVTGDFPSNVTHYFCFKDFEAADFDMWFRIVLGALYLSLIITLVFSYVSIIRFVKKNFSRCPGDSSRLAAAASSNNSADSNTAELTCTPSSSSSRIAVHALPQNRHRRTVRLILTLIALFLICRIPVWSFLIITTSSNHIIKPSKLNSTILHALQLLSNVKSAINPFVYAIWNDALRSPTSNPNNSNRTTSTSSRCWNICFSSQNKSQCSIANFWQWCRRGNPRSYDFTRQSKVGSSSTTNIKIFNAGDKNDNATLNKSTSYWNSKGIYTVDSSG